jgi:rSAM/selenodomain-associated transferase 2
VKIAVVIPALDEAREIADAVASASAPSVEVVVVDGGSRDGTVERAQEAGARVLAGARGRALQLRAGTDSSSAGTLLFLHADTRLPPRWSCAVEAALEDPGVCGGAFRLRFDDRSPGLCLVEWWVRLRVWLFGLPFGDQAIFVRRKVLDEIGGVPEVAVMEDVDLVKAMKTRGRLAMLPQAVTTSARRYREGGILRTASWHGLAMGARLVGIDRGRIKGWLAR